jgi:hypothetical protein
VLIKCHAGCATVDVAAALGLTLGDLFDEPKTTSERPVEVARYPYADEQGTVLYEVRRMQPKAFLPYLPGAAKAGIGSARRVLYRLPEVLEAVRIGEAVWLVEGEKDADNLCRAGVTATTWAFGAKGWRSHYASVLAEATVRFVADNDKAGLELVPQVTADLEAVGATVVSLLSAVGKDASDHLASGHGLEDFQVLTRDPVSPPAAGADYHSQMVADRLAVLRADEAARRLLRQEGTSVTRPSLRGLSDLLADPDETVTYRVERLWPIGGRVVLAAQYKAGKSTMVANLLRSLADAEDFLDHFTVVQPAGQIVVIDDELDERMLRRWLRDQGIADTDRVSVLSLRGRVSTFDLLDPAERGRWAADLRAVDAEVVILDCLRPVLDSLGLSEDKDAGRFLVAFDALLHEAKVSEAIVVHHMGHAGERSRGDSRMRDWPDVEWTLIRDEDDDATDTTPARYFRAMGRDVDQAEGLLSYDAASRRLRWSGGVTRKDTAANRLLPELVSYLAAHPSASGRQIETGVDAPRAEVRGALKRAISSGRVLAAEGPRRAILHTLNPSWTASAPSAPPVRQRTQSECASAPIGGALHSLPTRASAPSAHSAVNCIGCGDPLDPVMATLGDTAHPGCALGSWEVRA